MFDHCFEAVPRVKAESVSGSMFLDSVVVAKRLPLTLPVKSPVIASIAAASE